MDRIAQLFQQKKAFVGYLTIGDGGFDQSLAAAKALIAGGVNILELGVPFSDPIADGPVIQRASQRALNHNTSLFDVLKLAKILRQEFDIPLILFSYYNPLLYLQPSIWLPQAKEAGIDGILVVDLPYEEGKLFYKECHKHHIAPIVVLTPATTTRRLSQVLKLARGFLYYACQKGTTGIRSQLPKELPEKIKMIKSQTKLPVVAGFGIASAQDAHEALQYADGFVVGSFFIKTLEDGASLSELTTITRQFLSLQQEV